MMNFKRSNCKIQPKPCENLDKKSAAIWSGWSKMREREAAREAAVKGTHIDLIPKFLSARLDLNLSEAEKWFKDQINSWVLQLLGNNQIYKAQHVLKNMGLEPVKEIRNRFVDTTCVELRNIIGNHLLVNNCLEVRLQNSWHLLSSIENDEDTLAMLKQEHGSVNVSLIDGMDEEWRNETGTKLFFKLYNFDLESFVVPNATWRYLLENNHTLLKLWIEVYFGNESFSNQRVVNLDTHIVEKLYKLFSSFPITKNVVNSLWEIEIASDVREMVLDEFAKYGILSEREDVVQVFRRILSTNKANELESILMKHSAVNLNTFHKLVAQHCTDNGLYGVLNLYVKDTSVFSDINVTNKMYLNIIKEFRSLFSNLNNVPALRDNVIQTARLLCNGTSIERRSSDFPMILLAVIIFSDINILELLTTNITIEIDGLEINKDVLLCLDTLPTFSSLLNGTLFNPQLDQYDLLHKYCGIPRDLYGFRYTSSPIPHFSSEELIKKCKVYNKPLDYKHYLLECRPSYAAHIFKLNSTSNEWEINTVIKRVHKIALKNINNPAICQACVWFLEFLGVSACKLKLHLQVASFIQKANPDYPFLKKFVAIHEHAEEVNGKLESIIISNNSVNGVVDVFDTLKNYDLVMEFSSLHNLKWPKLFLQYCAENNMWVLFLIFVQMYKYPVDITHQMALLFKNVTLREHLSHAIAHDVPVEEINVFFTGNRDYRKHFLFKLGVQLSDYSGSSSDSMSLSSYGSALSYNDFADSACDNIGDNECLDTCANMLQVLIKCNNCNNPSKAFLQAAKHYKIPLFAVLANCYEPGSTVTHWFLWLKISSDIPDSSVACNGPVITHDTTLDLFRIVIERRLFKTLENSFNIFLPDHPLKAIIKVLNNCVRSNFDKDYAMKNIEIFHDRLVELNGNTCTSTVTDETHFIKEKQWIEETTLFLISMTLHNGFECLHHQIKFLDVLNDCDISKRFDAECPEFGNVSTVLQYVAENCCAIKFDLSVIHDRYKFLDQVNINIERMVQTKQYVHALKLAEVADVSRDPILIAQIKDEFNIINVPKFWVKWNEKFDDEKHSVSEIVRFYLECADGKVTELQKYEILKLAYECMLRYNFGIEEMVVVEKNLWLTYLNLGDEAKSLPSVSEINILIYQKCLKELDKIPQHYNVLNEHEFYNLGRTIDELLSFGDAYTPLKLEKHFGYQHDDVEVLKLCFSLAEKMLLPSELNARQKLLLSKTSSGFSSRRHTYISRVSRPYLTGDISSHMNETLELIMMLMNNASSGVPIISNVFTAYKLSLNIKRAYEDIVQCHNPLQMMREAFKNECNNKLEVVTDFLNFFSLSKEEVTSFLCEEITASVEEYSKSKLDVCVFWDMDMDTNFRSVIQLISDNCSMLGMKLYAHASTLYRLHTTEPEKLMVVIELLVRAHDCFTAHCNMEGISIILKKSQIIISLLVTNKLWKMIIRLLTGIGRYTEMAYVFQILRENGQLELLLRKGSRSDNNLKAALLDYLKKYCPDDVELYKVVALHFFLYSEIAALWEHESQSLIDRLMFLSRLDMENNKMSVNDQPFLFLPNSVDTKVVLKKIMDNYKQAAEYHMHSGKMLTAMNVAKKAQLTALQLALFDESVEHGPCVCIFKLSNTQIDSLILTQLSYPDICILTETYDYKVNWSAVIFKQCVVQNNVKFLNSFLASNTVTTSFINDLSRRIASSNIKDLVLDNVRIILNKIPSVHTKYRTASELGFHDVVENLLESDQMAFLKDTVWKKGYKS